MSYFPQRSFASSPGPSLVQAHSKNGTPLSRQPRMNWTDGDLHRTKRGRLRKVNPAKQRQKEYFARIRAQAEEREAARGDSRRSSSRQPVFFAHQPSPQPSPRGSSQGHQDQYSPGHEQAIEQLRSFFKVPARQDNHGSASRQPLAEPPRNQESATLLAKRRRRPVPPPRPDHRLRAPVVRPGAPSHIESRKRKHDLSMPDAGHDTVKIRVGSQQKRLGEGSTVSGWNTIRSASEARIDTSHPTRRPSKRVHNSSSRLSLRREQSPHETFPSSHIERDQESRGPECSNPLVLDLIDQSSSSSPLVRHVSRQRTGSLARSCYPDSQDTNSAIARVGRTIPNLPSSQKHSNTKWSSWFRGGGASNAETVDDSQCSPEVQVSPGVSQGYRQETESSWAGLSEDLPPIPDPEEVIVTRFDRPVDHPAIRSSTDTSEALDRYEQLLAIVQGNQQHGSYFHPTDNTGISSDSYDLNATRSIGKESMSSTDLDSRGAGLGNDGISTDSSRLNFTNRFGEESTSSSGFSSLGARQIYDRKHGNDGNRKSSKFMVDSEETFASSEPQDHGHISSGNTVTSHDNRWLNVSPFLESFPGAPKHQDTTHALEGDEGWRSFVFGDDNSDEVEMIAFNQASRDAARALQPSECSTASCTREQPEMEHNSTGATGCPLYTADIGQPSDSVEPWSSSDVPSLGAIASSSIIESDAGIIANHMDESNQDIPHQHIGDDHRESTHCESISEESVNEALTSHGSTGRQSLGEELTNNNSTSEFSSWESPRGEPSKTHASRSVKYVGSNTSGSLPASADLSSNAASTLAPPRPVGVNQSGVPGVEEQVRFAPPKLFVGSRSKPQERSKALGVLRAATKRRGRPKKRATDGRADIRGIPNYTSDPIEDFEDQQPTQRSIFPALELV
ncbi:hypothetical protein B0T21DRAFT_347163 [Apiosordaria backusii]|uniref:Uncharacterized protein n=1 Tax=Apiosordaria backusii TaxID=314023 RepID=A0AA40BTA3_9PEZI|nr:hypothetical protein B0T21DRAFT_347163 [Apiosordaria backusii]